MAAAQLLLDALAQVLQQVEAIGDLSRLRGTLSSALGVEPAAVAADDLDLGTLAEPSRGAVGGAIRQQVDDFTPLQVDDQRSVATALDPAPVIDPCHSQEWLHTDAASLAFEMPQDGVVARRHAQPRHQTLCRPSASRVAEQMNQLCHSACSPCIGRRYRWHQLGKRPLLASWVPALPPRHLDAERHDRPLFRQILKLSTVVAVTRGRWSRAAWTGAGTSTNSRNRPSSIKTFGVQNSHASPRRPLCFAFHSA